MNKQELAAMVAEILGSAGEEPMVKGGDYIHMAQGVIWQIIECIACNMHQFSGIVQILLLTLAETVNGVPCSLIHRCLGLWGRPEEGGAILCGNYGRLAYLLGSLVVYPGHQWSKRRIPMVFFL
jgi:hypothetical protein